MSWSCGVCVHYIFFSVYFSFALFPLSVITCSALMCLTWFWLLHLCLIVFPASPLSLLVRCVTLCVCVFLSVPLSQMFFPSWFPSAPCIFVFKIFNSVLESVSLPAFALRVLPWPINKTDLYLVCLQHLHLCPVQTTISLRSRHRPDIGMSWEYAYLNLYISYGN